MAASTAAKARSATVGADPRARLVEAMTRVAAAHGYAGASVARVVAEAGCSRATFYQHFSSREECFLAAYEAVAGRLLEALERTDALPATERPRAALTFVLSTAELEPSAALVASFEALGAGQVTRERREELFVAVESSVNRCLSELPPGLATPALPARALIGAVEGIVAARALRGEHARLGRLLFDLLAWLDSYALSADLYPGPEEWLRLGAQTATAASANVDPVSLGAAPFADPEARILGAFLQLVAERGFSAMKVTDLVAAAGVSRGTFYALFEGKDDVFRAAQIAGLQTTISRTAEAFFGADSWPERVWSGLAALLSYTAENSQFAFLDTVESCTAGAVAIRRSVDNRLAFNIFLQEGYVQHARARQLPAVCAETIGAAILELIRTAILAGEARRAPALLPQAAYVALAPFLGAAEAVEFIRQKASA